MFFAFAKAEPLPGPADIDRVIPTNRSAPTFRDDEKVIQEVVPADAMEAPQGAKAITFTLKEIRLEGVSAFPVEELQKLYTEYYGKVITLDIIWHIADKITNHYRQNGYFLSRAYIPAQEIDSGVIRIKVVEGYVGEIEAKGGLAEHSVIAGLIEEIKQQRPVSTAYIESSLLLLNDLPGINLRAIVVPLEAGSEAVKLILEPSDKDEKNVSLSYDNYGSRFLGPYQGTASYTDDLIDLQQTTITGLMARPARELKYGGIQHSIPLTARASIDFSGAYTEAEPGFTLRANEIESQSVTAAVAFKYKLIRQRTQNLEAKIILDMRNSNSDILQTRLTRDRIRAARIGLSYDVADSYSGFNYMGVTLSQGLDVLGAKDRRNLYISRLLARPDFTKFEAYYTRLQQIGESWMGTLSLQAQTASGSLYSSEEFGYGGMSFGRAYDSSEISGDYGANASVELAYQGFEPWQGITFAPYTFYDVGKIFNYNDDQESGMSAMSAGLGVRAASDLGINLNLGIAYPLTRPVATPVYEDSENMRYLFQITYGF